MSRPFLKICGVMDEQIAHFLTTVQVDYVGFVFAPSRRRVDPTDVQSWVTTLKRRAPHIQTVGVFTSIPWETWIPAIETVPLDVIQVHREAEVAELHAIKQRFPTRKVWQVLGMGAQPHAIEQRLFSLAGVVDAVLLDTHDDVVGGGTGRTFAWESIPVVGAWTKAHDMPLIIAGGLHADNVGTLCQSYGAWFEGVDVSSGVERMGNKDATKIATFIERVSACDV